MWRLSLHLSLEQVVSMLWNAVDRHRQVVYTLALWTLYALVKLGNTYHLHLMRSLIPSIDPILLVSLVAHDQIFASFATKNTTGRSKGILDVARAEYDEKANYHWSGCHKSLSVWPGSAGSSLCLLIFQK